jgi:hypothetical protein
MNKARLRPAAQNFIHNEDGEVVRVGALDTEIAELQNRLHRPGPIDQLNLHRAGGADCGN